MHKTTGDYAFELTSDLDSSAGDYMVLRDGLNNIEQNTAVQAAKSLLEEVDEQLSTAFDIVEEGYKGKEPLNSETHMKKDSDNEYYLEDSAVVQSLVEELSSLITDCVSALNEMVSLLDDFDTTYSGLNASENDVQEYLVNWVLPQLKNIQQKVEQLP